MKIYLDFEFKFIIFSIIRPKFCKASPDVSIHEIQKLYFQSIHFGDKNLANFVHSETVLIIQTHIHIVLFHNWNSDETSRMCKCHFHQVFIKS